jgi:FkbM family methyltransferase
MTKQYKIFVSIVSYRDAVLEQTVHSLIDNLSNYNEITISILDQSYDTFSISHPCIIYNQIDPKFSKGVGWARHQNSLNLTNEDFYYQIDSHAIFDKNWDLYLIDDYLAYKAEYLTSKIAMSSACHSFSMIDGVATKDTTFSPTEVLIAKYTRKPILSETNKHLSVHSYYYNCTDRIIPAIHLYGGNFFTHSEFISTVGICPHLFFTGEEQYLTLSAFFNDYKLVHHTSIHNYHLTYNNNTYLTKLHVEPVISDDDLLKLETDSINFFNEYINSISNDDLQRFYEYSGVDYKNNHIDEQSLCDFLGHISLNQCYQNQSYPSFWLHSTEHGLTFLLTESSDIISNEIREYGVFGESRYSKVVSLLANIDSPVIYDIGCNFGTFSLPLAKILPTSEIFSFEVQRLVLYQLCANIALNQAFNILPINVAVGAESQIIQVNDLDYVNSSNYGAYTLDTNIRLANSQGNVYYDTTYTIDQFALDDLDLPRPNLIKISVGGTDIKVLKGAVNLIKESQPIILIECWDAQFYKTQRNELIDYVTQLNYSIQYTVCDYLLLTYNT